MVASDSLNSQRIAKNTIVLYLRTLLIMVVSLFTSRVVLNILGIQDYGIYNIVGGIVAMFSVISGSLSNSISRFLTFELGKGASEKLNLIFCTSVNIQVFISVIILIIGEIIGIYFLNNKANIPEMRLNAANWVLHCSLFSFIIGLLSVPYNSAIIAHERMSAFAYVSAFEVTLKLVAAYLLYISPFDNLISYAILLSCISFIIQCIYIGYCKRNFPECNYSFVFELQTAKSMGSFAGWSFFTNTAYIFNTQGINILINLFFGVTVNAARGIATQIESAVMNFINNFTIAINPQITKSYACGDLDYMNKLICRGAKFSYLMLACLAIPLMFETPMILKLWLNIIPEHTVTFFRLSIIGTMFMVLGNTGYTACMATGRIKKYVIVITTLGCLVFPLTWIVYKLGAPVESTYIVYICTYILVDIIRLLLMKELLGFPPMLFIKKVFFKIVIVTMCAVIIPFSIIFWMDSTLLRMFVNIIITFLCVALSSYYLGLTLTEKIFVKSKIKRIWHK